MLFSGRRTAGYCRGSSFCPSISIIPSATLSRNTTTVRTLIFNNICLVFWDRLVLWNYPKSQDHPSHHNHYINHLLDQPSLHQPLYQPFMVSTIAPMEDHFSCSFFFDTYLPVAVTVGHDILHRRVALIFLSRSGFGCHTSILTIAWSPSAIAGNTPQKY